MISRSDIKKRVLDVVTPTGKMPKETKSAIDKVKDYAEDKGVDVNVGALP